MTSRLIWALPALLATLAIGPWAGAASASDSAATQTYLQANYALVRTGVSPLKQSETAIAKLVAQVRSECPLAAASSPQDAQSTELSNEVIGAMVINGARLDLPAIHSFLAKVAHLSWSGATVNRAIHDYVSELRKTSKLSTPAVCSDVRGWAASGFKTLTPATVSFDSVFTLNWVSLGELPHGLSAFENAPQRALAQKTVRLEEKIAETEANAVERWGEIMNELELNP
jgi:hypothetical protein